MVVGHTPRIRSSLGGPVQTPFPQMLFWPIGFILLMQDVVYAVPSRSLLSMPCLINWLWLCSGLELLPLLQYGSGPESQKCSRCHRRCSQSWPYYGLRLYRGYLVVPCWNLRNRNSFTNVNLCPRHAIAKILEFVREYKEAAQLHQTSVSALPPAGKLNAWA